MIKFLATKRDGSPVYGFGLSEGNLRLLREGKPIEVDLSQMGSVGAVVIFYGSDEQAMVDELSKHGMIGDDVVLNEQTQLHEGSDEH